MNTHPEQWAAIYAAAPGEQLGVRCLAQGHLSRGIEGGESAGNLLPLLQFLPAQDSNSQPLDYKSDSLTIRPRLKCVYRTMVVISEAILKHAYTTDQTFEVSMFCF